MVLLFYTWGGGGALDGLVFNCGGFLVLRGMTLRPFGWFIAVRLDGVSIEV